MRQPFEYTSPYYDNAEFVVSNGASNYDVASNQTSLFGGVSSTAGSPVNYVSIRTSQTITVSINGTSGVQDAITITTSDSPFTLDEVIEVRNVYISNAAGATANVKILATKGQTV